MKNTKFNPELLKEELKRFKLLTEWDFYMENEPDDREMIYGNKILDEESPEDDADSIASDLGVDNPDDGGMEDGDGPNDDMGMDDTADDMGGGAPPEPAVPEAPPAPAPAPPMPEPSEDEVEVDITDLVQDSKTTKLASFKANQHTKELLQKFEELEARVSQMDMVTQQIADLEKEIIKRNPTPVENLEMQTVHSAPYTQKLTDYWADKEGPYDVMHNNSQKYVLDRDAIDSDYSVSNIKKSFDVRPSDNDYEEEDY